MEDFRRDYAKEHLKDLTPDERLEGLSVEERLAGFSLEEIENYLKRCRGNFVRLTEEAKRSPGAATEAVEVVERYQGRG